MKAQRPRIGYITPRISDENGLAIWRGMVEAAQGLDVDLFCFAGGEVRHPERAVGGEHAAHNAVYDLVDQQSLDGIIVWGSSLGYYAGPEAAHDFCRRFEPLPMVSIGVAMPGIPGVVVDSYDGVRAAMAHLVEVHGRRRLAFIRGPAAHREAQHRYRAYCDTLAAYGIPLNPDLVSPPYLWVQADGAGLEANGAEAIRLFLDERRVSFDAVVASNDTLALGALAALQMRGVSVPEDVSLVGFDDKPAGRIVSPPLTTLKAGLHERGGKAVTMLLARLNGESLPDEVSLPTRLVIRRSCGCFDAAVLRAGNIPADSLLQADQAVERHGSWTGIPSADIRAAILAEVDRELEAPAEPLRRGDDAVFVGAALLDALWADLIEDPGASNRFLNTLAGLLHRAGDASDQAWNWQAALSTLRVQTAPYLAEDGNVRERAEAIWHQARVLVGEHARRAQASADHHAGQRSDRLHAIGRALAPAEDIPELLEILAAELPAIGIAACAVALYDDPHAPTGGCRLMLAYDERGRLNLPPEGEPRSAPALASGGWLAAARQHSIVIEPLSYRDEPLGFLMLDGGGCEGQVYRVIQEQVSSALRGVLLLQENLRLYHAALAAQQVAQEKQQLAEQADRLKSRFLSMVSHELRTPLILLEGLSEMMLRAGQSDHGGAMGVRPPLPEAYRQDLERIRATSQQLSGLIRDVLDLSRGQVGQLRLTSEPLELADALQPTLLIGEQMVRSKGLDWQAEIAADLPRIRGDGARLQEVTLNLISNAVKFTASGEVRLRIAAEAGGAMVSISDTGLGVPIDEQQAIFDEFRQSERTAARGYGGMGVGLAICRQIVQLHGGRIGVRSSGREDGGSTFFYWLPAYEEAAPAAAGQGATARSPETSAGDDSAPPAVLLTDRAVNGKYLQTCLLKRGFEVALLPVEEMDDWEAHLLALRPSAIVLDLHEATWERGWQLIDVLKLREETRDIPIMLYSLLAEQDQGAVLALDFLAKPMRAAALSQSLWNLGLPEGATVKDATILIADDDPAVLALHRDIVGSHFPNCRVLTALNGRQALDILQRGERPLLILLDLMMPELDGVGFLEAIQGDAELRDIPVIVLTAQRLSEEDIARLGRGVTSIMQKGMFTTEETIGQIERALARNKQLHSETRQMVRKAMAYIQTNYAQSISRVQLADHVGVSPRHLTRCFSQEVGLSPIDYLNRFRVNQARRLLDEDNMSITEVMYAVGFGDSSYFSRVFRREVGVSPRGYYRSAHGRSQPASDS